MQNIDVRDDKLTTATLYFGRPEYNDIEVENDSDWFKVQLISGVAYSFVLQGVGNEDEKLAMPLIQGLFDSEGVPDLSVELNDDQTVMSFTPTVTGEYFIGAGARESGVGAYQLAMDVSNVTPVEGLNLGVDEDSVLDDASGVNAHRLSLLAGSNYSINLEGASFGGVVNQLGVLMLPPVTVENDVVSFSPLESGDYFLLASTPTDPLGSYQLLVKPDIIAKDNVSLELIDAALEIGASVEGEISIDFNTDLYHVWLNADKSYQIDLEGTATEKGTLKDALIRGIYNSHGVLLVDVGGDDDSGEGHNARLEFTPTETGFYYISAGGYLDNQGIYTLSVNEVAMPESDDFGMGGVDEIAGVGILDRTTVEEGSTKVVKKGSIEVAGDQDGFEFTVRSGYYYTIDVEGASTEGSGTLYDPQLIGLYNTAGDLILGYDDDDSGDGLNARLSAAVDFNATLYLAVGAYNNQAMGTYTVSINEELITAIPSVEDDRSADVNVRDLDKPLNIAGDARTGEVEVASDVDWFHLGISTAGDYLIDIKGYEGIVDVPALEDPRLMGIYDSNGEFILGTHNDDGGVGLNARFTFKEAELGDYFVSVAGWGEQTGGYSVSVISIIADDFGQTKDAAKLGEVSVDSTVVTTGVIEIESDQDWFRVSLEADSYYQIDLTNTSGNIVSPLVAKIEDIYNANGMSLEKSNETSSIIFHSTAEADYFISAAGDGASTGSYALSITTAEAPSEPDFTNDIKTLGVIDLGVSVNSSIDSSGDEDWFRISLVGGESYHISLEGKILADPVIEGVYTSTGARLSNSFDDDNGVGLNSLVDFTARSTGDYFISAAGAEFGTYSLRVTKNSADYDDFNDDQSTTANIKVNASSFASIEKGGDKDAFMMSLDANKTYMIGMEGAFTQSGNLVDPIIVGIYASDGTLQANTQDDDGGENLNSLLTFTPSEGGDYYVVASAFEDFIGSYTMTLNEAKTDDFISSSSDRIEQYLKDFEDNLDIDKAILDVALESGTLDEIEAIEAIEAFEKSKIIKDLTEIKEIVSNERIGYVTVGGENATGVIENPNDRDWFAAYLVEGQRYKVNLSSSSKDDALSDTYLDGIYRRNGSFISGTENDDLDFGVSNSEVNYTAAVTGVYYISVGGFSIETGSYDLSIV